MLYIQQAWGKLPLYQNWLNWLAVVIMSWMHVCVCVRTLKAGSPRVGIKGQSSLYAVCRAPRQKRCRAVKHSVTKTTCFRVYNRQTQAASAVPHQELVLYHQGLHFNSSATPVQHCAFYRNQENTIKNTLPPLHPMVVYVWGLENEKDYNYYNFWNWILCHVI